MIKFEKLLSFDIKNTNIIGELEDGAGTFQILTSSDNLFIHFRPYYLDDDCFFDFKFCQSNYYLVDNFNNIPIKLCEILNDYYKGSPLILYINQWWSFLPDWIILSPKYLDTRILNIFRKELSFKIDKNNYQFDLKFEEKEFLNNWVNFLQLEKDLFINEHHI